MRLANQSLEPVTNVIHGVAVVDRYRWLEERSLPETKTWIADQQRHCAEYFADCGGLNALERRVREYLDVEVLDQPARVAGQYFYRRRNRGQEQAVIVVRDVATGYERRLVDPSGFGTSASVGIHRISEGGSLVAYELRYGGQDAKEIRFVDVASSRMLPNKIESGYIKGFVFAPNRKGFFYCPETPSTSEDHVVSLHLFDEPAMERIIFRVARTRESRLILTADSVHLGAMWIHGRASELMADFWVTLLDAPTGWKQIFADQRLPFSPILKEGRIFVLLDDDDPKGPLVELLPDGAGIRTVVPKQGGMIQQVVILESGIFIKYLHHLTPSIHRWSFSGSDLGTVDIPIEGTIHLLPNLGEYENNLFYTYESFTKAPVIFEYFPERAESRLWDRRHSPDAEGSRFVKKVSFSSQDGTRIPMTLVSRRDHDPKPSPMIMTSYGGFGVPMTPQFSVLVSIMTELGAAFALPHIRGGGDFGRSWHEAGRAQNRQTAFDDFTAAAEWLCKEGLTLPEQLAIFGGSNSGLLVGVAMTQRPDLFRAVLCIAPLLDMVRYERFDHAAKWRQEYGTVDEAEGFHSLYAYSPYHHVEGGVDYPAVLFVSGDKDDRCNPAHVRKMAAHLLEKNLHARSIVVDYSPERGHCPVLPLSVRVGALARRIAFLCRELNMAITVGGTNETNGA